MSREQIDEIMKPYYDEKAEQKKIFNQYEEEKKIISAKLEELRKNRKNAVDNYITSALLNFNHDFCDKDENEQKNYSDDNYLEEEKLLENELNRLDIESKQALESLIEPLNKIKIEIVSRLKEAQKKIISDLQSKRIDLFDARGLISLRIKDSKNTLVSNVYSLYDKKNQISDEISELHQNLKIIEKYLDELVPEEKNQIKDTKDSYLDFRKNIDKIISDHSVKDSQEDIVDYSELTEKVYNGILKQGEHIDSVSLISNEKMLETNNRYFNSDEKKNYIEIIDIGSLNLPDGDYINYDNFYKALKQYYKKNKGQSLVVNEIKKSLVISKKDIKKIRELLRECSTIILLKDKKNTDPEIKKIIGEEKVSNGTTKIRDLGYSETEKPSGRYISKEEILSNLKNMFEEEKNNTNSQNDYEIFNIDEQDPIHKK